MDFKMVAVKSKTYGNKDYREMCIHTVPKKLFISVGVQFPFLFLSKCSSLCKELSTYRDPGRKGND